MPDADRLHWNAKYQAAPYDFAPHPRLQATASLLRPAPGTAPLALDLACGGGRNSLFLAQLGWQVHAWDLSDVGLDMLRRALADRARAGAPLPVAPRQVDLEAPDFRLPAQVYDLIVVVLFLHRPLLPGIAAAVRPGGLVFYHTYLDAGRGARHRPEHKLAPGELAAAFPGWAALWGGDDPANGVTTLLARRPPAWPGGPFIKL